MHNTHAVVATTKPLRPVLHIRRGFHSQRMEMRYQLLRQAVRNPDRVIAFFQADKKRINWHGELGRRLLRVAERKRAWQRRRTQISTQAQARQQALQAFA